MKDIIYTKEEVAELLRISTATLQRIRDNKGLNFPQSFSFTGGFCSRPVWLVSDIEEWIIQRAQQVKDKKNND